MRFFQAVHEDEDLGGRLRALRTGEGLAPVVALAASAGFDVSEESLADGFAYDWLFRSAYYRKASASSENAESAESTVAVVNNPLSSM